MGRGRAKAKQQKVARELKYSTHFTDLDALQRELGTSTGSPSVDGSDGSGSGDELEDDDEFADIDGYADEYQDWTGTDR
jgi:hypothetical protein